MFKNLILLCILRCFTLNFRSDPVDESTVPQYVYRSGGHLRSFFVVEGSLINKKKARKYHNRLQEALLVRYQPFVNL